VAGPKSSKSKSNAQLSKPHATIHTQSHTPGFHSHSHAESQVGSGTDDVDDKASAPHTQGFKSHHKHKAGLFSMAELQHIHDMVAKHDTEITAYAKSINRSPAAMFAQVLDNHLLKHKCKKNTWNATQQLAAMEHAQDCSASHEDATAFHEHVLDEYCAHHSHSDGDDKQQPGDTDEEIIACAEQVDLLLAQSYKHGRNVTLVMQKLAKDLSESVCQNIL